MTTETTHKSQIRKLATGIRDNVLDMIVAAVNDPEVTIGMLMQDFEAEGMTIYLEVLQGLSFADIAKALTSQTKTKTKAERPEIPSWENWKDEAVQKAKRQEVVALITAVDVKGGDRGLTPIALRQKVGGSEGQMRDLLAALVADKVIVSTGLTKGLKYVLAKHAAAAETLYQKEKAERDAKKAEKEAKAAKAAAEAKAAK